jgi:hypothetical protein
MFLVECRYSITSRVGTINHSRPLAVLSSVGCINFALELTQMESANKMNIHYRKIFVIKYLVLESVIDS